MKNKKTNKPLYALFYYDRRKLKQLLIFNLIVLAVLVVFGKNIFYPLIPAGLLVILLSFLSTLASAHVCFFPQKLAIVTDEEIKIDRNTPLKWKNIAEANEIFAGPGRRRRIIVLRPVEGFKYRLTFMQRICRYLKFTAFSIPLYAMTGDDAEKIRTIVAAHTAFNDQTRAKPND